MIQKHGILRRKQIRYKINSSENYVFRRSTRISRNDEVPNHVIGENGFANFYFGLYKSKHINEYV
jgi:hypothetical protein